MVVYYAVGHWNSYFNALHLFEGSLALSIAVGVA